MSDKNLPDGVIKVDAYFHGNTGQLIVLGDPHDDPGHDCKAMGCGSAGHVVLRESVSRAVRRSILTRHFHQAQRSESDV